MERVRPNPFSDLAPELFHQQTLICFKGRPKALCTLQDESSSSSSDEEEELINLNRNLTNLHSSSDNRLIMANNVANNSFEDANNTTEDEETLKKTPPVDLSRAAGLTSPEFLGATSSSNLETIYSPNPETLASKPVSTSITSTTTTTMADSEGQGHQGRKRSVEVDKQSVFSQEGVVSEQTEECQATMWLGTEDGHIHVYNCTDNIRIKKNKEKFFHPAPVLSILYLDNRVYASLGNGNIMVYSRNSNGVWDKTGAKVLPVGTAESPVTKMITIGTRIWCIVKNTIKIINSEALELETSFQVESDDDAGSRGVLSLVHSGWAVWIAMEQSAKVKAFHVKTLDIVTEIKIGSVVNKVLVGCDEIIRQHKAACLRITALLACKDILWIGTSAGVIVTMRLPHITSTPTKISQLPPLIGNPHGHSGHVRFLTCVEMTPETGGRKPFSKNGRFPNRTGKPPGNEPAGVAGNAAAGQSHFSSKMLVISGGDGYEDFGNAGSNEMIGREDSTNHLLLWQI